MKIYAKLVSIMLSFSLLLSLITLGHASDSPNNTNNNLQLVNDYISAIDRNDWSEWAMMYIPSLRNEYVSFINENIDSNSRPGILAVSSAKILSVIPISSNYAPRGLYPQIDAALEDPSNVECYLVSIDMTVWENNDYFQAGTTNKIVTLAKENNSWGVVALSNATENTSDYLARAGLVGYNIADPDTKPLYINVKTNIGVLTTSTSEYVRNVITNEVPVVNYEDDALKALCVAAYSHVWFYCLSGVTQAQGYDINASSGVVNYQPYTIISVMLSELYSQVKDYYIVAGTNVGYDEKHFSTPYNSFPEANHQSSGQMYEDGADALAESGYTWQEIIHYYYDNSNYNYTGGTGIVQILYY